MLGLPLCLVAVDGAVWGRVREIELLAHSPWKGGRFLTGVFARRCLPCEAALFPSATEIFLGLFVGSFLPMSVGGLGCALSRMQGRQRASLGTDHFTLCLSSQGPLAVHSIFPKFVVTPESSS